MQPGVARRAGTFSNENGDNNMKTLIAAAAIAALPGIALGQQPSNAGRDMAAACAICHGTAGNAPGGMPALAGQSSETLLRHMRDFRDGKRPATIMHQIAKGYTDEQMQTLAAWFAAQKPAR